jgi:hypothetical protein
MGARLRPSRPQTPLDRVSGNPLSAGLDTELIALTARKCARTFRRHESRRRGTAPNDEAGLRAVARHKLAAATQVTPG